MTNTLRSVKVWAWTAAAVLMASSAFAQAASPAAGGQARQVDPYVVGQAKPPEVPGAAVRNLSLEDAYAVALENNLELKVARMNPQGLDYQLQGARAAFLPRISGSYGYSNSTRPSNDSQEGKLSVTDLSQNFNSSMNQTLPWWGSSMSLSFNNSRSSTDRANTFLPTSFSSSLAANLTLPLLANRAIDNTRNQLRTLQIQRQVVDLQLEETIENTKDQVRRAYWALRQAIEQIEIQRHALELAQRQFEDNKLRVEIGTMAQIETTTSETQVVNAEQALLNAEISWQTAELNLKRLLASGPDDDIFRTTINPVDVPAFEPPVIDPNAAARTALNQRLDIVQAHRNIDISRLNLQVSKNATLPGLDASASYRLSGQGNPYTDALGRIKNLDNPTWSVSFNFSYPLGMRAARANYARAQLQLDQTLASLRAQELNVSNEVYNAGLAVQNTYKQLEVAIKARDVAVRNAEAEQVRFDVGMSNPYNVALAQNNLTNARLTELSRMIAYINAVAEFERVQRFGR